MEVGGCWPTMDTATVLRGCWPALGTNMEVMVVDQEWKTHDGWWLLTRTDTAMELLVVDQE